MAVSFRSFSLANDPNLDLEEIALTSMASLPFLIEKMVKTDTKISRLRSNISLILCAIVRPVETEQKSGFMYEAAVDAKMSFFCALLYRWVYNPLELYFFAPTHQYVQNELTICPQ